MTATPDLAKFVDRTSFNDVPRDVRNRAKACLLDWLGVALAGSVEPPSKLVLEVIEHLKGRKDCTVIGTRLKTTCVNAALVNGTSGHAIELDDINQEGIIHPAAPVIPAALAIAELVNASGKDLLTAIILGYEIEIRIAAAITPSHYELSWHTTGTCGTFGAATAAGKLLGLHEKGITYALGLAATEAAGLVSVFGTMTKPFNPGRAAMDGVIAALLAKEGFVSPTNTLDDENGYFHAAARNVNAKKLSDGLGKNFKIVDTVIKRHASCGHTHAAIDAVLEIKEKTGVREDDVVEVDVKTYPIAVNLVGKNNEPKTPAEAKFSLPYCVASALRHGKVGVQQFSPKELNDPKTRKLSKIVRVSTSRGFQNTNLGQAKVRLVTKEGQELVNSVDTPKGYPQNPLTKSELESKFFYLASFVANKKTVTEILNTVNSLETMPGARELTCLLSHPKRRS
jgi:2-methylcitrate dehydratase PrpD